MNFLRRFYLEREAKRLEERIEKAPEPNDILKLLPILLEMGEKDKADSLKKKAREMYPGLDLDTSRYEVPEKNPSFDTDAEIRDVQAMIDAEPDPWLYGRLARLHMNAGRLEHAEEVAKRAHSLYPNHPYPLAILAELRVFRNDKKTAAAYFSQAVRIDSQSSVSIVHLSQFYNEIKDFERTRKLLEQLLVPQKTSAAAHVPHQPGPPIPGEVARVAVELPSDDAHFGMPPTTQVSAEPGGKAAEVINQLRTLRYFQGALLLDFDGKVLGGDLPYSLPESEVQKTFSNLWNASMSQAQQMGLGEFKYTAFEGESGGCLIVQTAKCVTGMLFDKRRRLDQDGQELFEFCKNLC
ncbi:MAG: hypothetical protein Kow00107_04830 [Planctomycetota bacterium]